MTWLRLFPIPAIAMALIVPVTSPAQSGSGSSGTSYPTRPLPADISGSSYKTTLLPQPSESIAPFSLSPSTPPGAKFIEYRTEAQMPAEDHALVAAAEPAIRERATLAGMELGTGQWSRRQLVCPALKEHVFLLYERNNGAGDVSEFSAAIARASRDDIQVIAIRRRGYAPFTPAAVNPLSIAAYNRIRATEPGNRSQDWLATALCYAALTGAYPEPSSKDKTAMASLDLSFPPTLEVGEAGEATVRFVDVAAVPKPMQWALTFNAQGQLLKVTRFATPGFDIKLIPQLASEQIKPPAPR